MFKTYFLKIVWKNGKEKMEANFCITVDYICCNENTGKFLAHQNVSGDGQNFLCKYSGEFFMTWTFPKTKIEGLTIRKKI